MFDTHTLLLFGHVAGAILILGPLTAAASRFPAIAASPDPAARNRSVALELHRTTRTYGTAAVVVPVLGVVMAAHHSIFAARWIQLSLGLVVVAAVLLFAQVLPGQARVLDQLGTGTDTDGSASAADIRRLRMVTGLFALTWILIVLLMVAKP